MTRGRLDDVGDDEVGPGLGSSPREQTTRPREPRAFIAEVERDDPELAAMRVEAIELD